MTSSTRANLLISITQRIADYRQGEIPARTPDDVERWVRQFDDSVQDAMLAEMDHVLKQSYLSRDYFLNFLRRLAGTSNLIGGIDLGRLLRSACAWLRRFVRFRSHDRLAFPGPWATVRLLEIQKHGSSQRDMAHLLREVLRQDHGLMAMSSGPAPGPFLYLDDVLFTGNRIIADVVHWIRTEAPPRADLVVAVIAVFRRGFWYAQKALRQAATAARKLIRFHWLWAVDYEDRHWANADRDAFHPTELPEDPLAHAYARRLSESGSFPRFRTPSVSSRSRLFTCEKGRHLLEQQLLRAGLKIRTFYRNPQEVMRPLGYHMLKDLGFGSTVVTYRNCPNNCPLAWWWDTSALPIAHAGVRWYPLLPRRV